MLAIAAPIRVPATLSRDPRAAAVIAASAPAMILVIERSSLLTFRGFAACGLVGASIVRVVRSWWVLMSSVSSLGRA